MIYFHKEDIEFPSIKKQKTKNWIKKIIHQENREVGDINYIFCSDEYLLEMNKNYLKHNYYTDVITFDYVEGNSISGDIYISVERIRNNAKNLNVPFLKEFNRVIVHGVLHLLGYNDGNVKEKRTMRKKEDDYLSMLNHE